MQKLIAPEDRKLAIFFGVLLVTALAIAGYTVASDGGTGALPSSYSAGNSGTKAAFLLLQQTGYSPQRSTDSPEKLSKAGTNATLILADPQVGEERDAESVRQFVRGGGRVVVTGLAGAKIFKHGHTAPGMPHFEWKSYTPSEPSDLTQGIREIVMAPQFYFRSWDAETPFSSENEHPITRFSYGAGQVIWWATSEPMSNAGIREKDNARLLLNCIGNPGRGPVYWDEYFHEGGKTVVGSVIHSPLRWGLLQAALLAAMIGLTYSRRFGPIRESIAPPRLAPMEYVETLAALYRRANASHITVEIVYERFRGMLHRRYSLRTDATVAKVAACIAEHIHDSDVDQIQRTIRRVEDAAGNTYLKEKEATELVHTLHRYWQQLESRSWHQ
jgi:hypothetical protein